MVGWILVLPGSWRGGRWQWHDDMTAAFYASTVSKNGHFSTPLSLITKYNGHSIAQFCHILPGFVWAGLIPFQLHPNFRRKYRRAHRVSGYIFLATACLMVVGFVYIDVQGLVYLHADFPSIPVAQNTTWLPIEIPHQIVFRGIAGWFLVTLLIAIWYAVKRRVSQHRKWIFRHVAAGIWVAVQRLVVLAVNAKLPENQKKTFGDGALLGVFLTFGAAEVAVFGYTFLGYKQARLK